MAGYETGSMANSAPERDSVIPIDYDDGTRLIATAIAGGAHPFARNDKLPADVVLSLMRGEEILACSTYVPFDDDEEEDDDGLSESLSKAASELAKMEEALAKEKKRADAAEAAAKHFQAEGARWCEVAIAQGKIIGGLQR